MAKQKKKKEFFTTFKSYKEIKFIGEGGSGRVLYVEDSEGGYYALKILKENPNKEKKARFKNELYFQSMTKHPNIISVLDFGLFQEGDTQLPFYVMPYYKKSLRNLMQEGIKAQDTEKYISDIIDGVEAAHKLKIVHRDLKPENILYDEQNRSLLIADFGIARFGEDNLYTAIETKDSTRLANFRYSAPEQRDPSRYSSVNEKSDIYAIGLIINEMFTGDVPQGVGYKTIWNLYPDYAFLDDIVEKMIRQNPEDRFNNIESLKGDLIGNKLKFIEQQELIKQQSKVIRVSEIDDELINNPPRLIDAGWQDGILQLKLSQAVNQKWITSLYNMGNYTALMGKDPESFSISDNVATVSVPEYEAQLVINHFKEWLPNVNTIYKRTMEGEREAEIKRQQKAAEAEIERRKRNLRVNTELKI